RVGGRDGHRLVTRHAQYHFPLVPLRQQPGVELAVGGLDQVRDVLRLDRLRRVEEALQDLRPRGLLADVAQVRPQRAAGAADAVTGDTLQARRLEEQFAAALDVALAAQDLLRPDHTP